jgi:hypothetical protein
MYPSIRYTGRLNTDPLNQMTITERAIMNGGGCQTSTSKRWGDYSTMRVDASSPTTFWYATEYYSQTSSSNWQTRVASFSFANVFSSYATANPVKVCIGDSSQLNTVAYGGSGAYTYSWTSLPAGFASTLRNPKVSPQDTTTYIVAVTDGSQTHHDTTAVKMIPHPAVFAGNDTTVCAQQTSVDLHGTASGYNALAWVSSGNGHFNTQSALINTYTFGTADYQAGSVNLELIAFPISPCSGNVISTRHVILDPCNAIPETLGNETDLLLEPNPARGTVTIIINGLTGASALLTVTSMKGQELSSYIIPGPATTVTKQIDLQTYPAGVYIIRVKTDKKIITKRLILE